jgi:6-phosphogluconolactonase
MDIQVFGNDVEVARRAAVLIAEEARASQRARGQFVFAVSGGRTPWLMLRALTEQDVPWDAVRLVQVDERVAPDGDAQRNLTHIRDTLLAHAPLLHPSHVYPMPVESADLDAAARAYAQTLRDVAGSPPVFDLCHLGLGPDGHTASLVPGDSVLDVTDVDVALTGGTYQGRRRMTLTYPVLNRSRRLLWLVTGAEKASPLARLVAADPSIPAGRVAQDRALVIADRAAAGTASDRPWKEASSQRGG